MEDAFGDQRRTRIEPRTDSKRSSLTLKEPLNVQRHRSSGPDSVDRMWKTYKRPLEPWISSGDADDHEDAKISSPPFPILPSTKTPSNSDSPRTDTGFPVQSSSSVAIGKTLLSQGRSIKTSEFKAFRPHQQYTSIQPQHFTQEEKYMPDKTQLVITSPVETSAPTMKQSNKDVAFLRRQEKQDRRRRKRVRALDQKQNMAVKDQQGEQ